MLRRLFERETRVKRRVVKLSHDVKRNSMKIAYPCVAMAELSFLRSDRF